MKLATPDWKAAWLEHRVSDRFFQEMARLDKSLVHQLGDTTRWCTQLAIELGSIAQPLQRLESGAPADGELKQAYERAIRLAGLAAHLAVALHEAVTEPTSAARYPLRGTAAAGAAAGDAQTATPQTESPPEAPAPPRREASVSPLRMQEGKAATRSPAPLAATPESADDGWAESAMDLPSDFTGADEGTMAHTIRSLSERGLSRGEIEIVTGQPRTLINEVLSAR